MAIHGKVLQPNEIFEIFGYKKDQDFGTIGKEDSKLDANKVLSWAFAVLMYLKPGDIVETSTARFKKIAPDLIQIDHNINIDQLMDDLENRSVVKLPV